MRHHYQVPLQKGGQKNSVPEIAQQRGKYLRPVPRHNPVVRLSVPLQKHHQDQLLGVEGAIVQQNVDYSIKK